VHWLPGIRMMNLGLSLESPAGVEGMFSLLLE